MILLNKVSEKNIVCLFDPIKVLTIAGVPSIKGEDEFFSLLLWVPEDKDFGIIELDVQGFNLLKSLKFAFYSSPMICKMSWAGDKARFKDGKPFNLNDIEQINLDKGKKIYSELEAKYYSSKKHMTGKREIE